MGVARADLTNAQLYAAVCGVRKHAGRRPPPEGVPDTGREWRPTDSETMAEFVKRTWNWAAVEGMKMVGVPRCVENLLFHVSATGRRMHRTVWRPLLGACVAAYRSGSMGVRLSLEQVAVLIGASRRTAARVVRELVEAGLLRREHTYQCDDGERDRIWDVSVYTVGGRLLAKARGGLERGKAGARWAAAARQRAKGERRERYLALWNAQRESRGPSFAERWLGVGASESVSLRGSDKVAPTPLNSGGHKQSGPPDCEKSKVGGRSLPSSTAPLQAARAPERHQEPGAPLLATSAPEEQGNPSSWARQAVALLFSAG